MAKDITKMQEECITCPFPKGMQNDLCYICSTQRIMRGKWKLLIIWLLRDSAKRFSQLQREIPNVKQGPLTAQLKELADDGIINRISYNQVPPKVEYSLTQKGQEFLSVMDAMDTWSRKNLFK